MEYEREHTVPIGPEQVAQAAAILQRYKAGKAGLDQRILDNEQWFCMRHWKNHRNPMMEGKPQPASGWLFNSIANKHADAMDNYPEPCVLPRAADDEAAARTLSSILPVVLEQADYEQAYSDAWWRKLKQGTGVKGVFWDPEKNGVGDIAVRTMDLLMLYWEPGVMDIQNSPNLFSLSLEDTAQLVQRWPQLKGHEGSTLDLPRMSTTALWTPAARAWWWIGTISAAEPMAVPGCITASSATGWCCMPARMTRSCASVDFTIMGNTPLCSTLCFWRRTAPPVLATSM